MNDDSFIISGFGGNDGVESATFVGDFAAARQLDRSGSTCDAYECVIQRRRVFVKRLKARFRDNPLYRAAFSKEYDLGITLNHPSLPRYVGFGGEYIAMDFVEGETLAELMKRGDRRLENRRFVVRLMNELINVVEYLHSRNIVHCDIKADNIIVSPHNDRPLTLIDLDKAYTSWLDDTSGNPANYGCTSCADGAIDFKGIGLIAEKLGMKRLAKACGDSRVSADLLRTGLENGTKAAWWAAALLVAIGVLMAAALFLSQHASTDRTGIGEQASIREADVMAPDSVAQPLTQPGGSAEQPAARQREAIDNDWIARLIAEKSGEIEAYRQSLIEILDSDSIPISSKRTAMVDYTEHSCMAIVLIMDLAVKKFEAIPELDVQKAVRSNPAWIRLIDDEAKMQKFLSDWRPMQATQQPPVRPISPPDTVRDSVPHAPRR